MSNGVIITIVICGTIFALAVLQTIKTDITARHFDDKRGDNSADKTDANTPSDPFADFNGGNNANK